MANVSPNDIVRVTAQMSFGSDAIQNVYHAEYQGAAPVADLAFKLGIASALDTAYGNIIGLISNQVSFDNLEFFNITQDRPMFDQPWPTLINGVATGEPLPPQTAPLVLFNTEVARSQGRKFLPVFDEPTQSGGTLVPTAITNLGNYATAILSGAVTGAGNAFFGNWSPTKLRFAEWTVALVQELLRTQRRRVVGVGE